MKKSFYFYTSIALTIILGLVIGNYIFGWTIPTANPPSSNLPAPINTGSSNQSKSGFLAVGTTTTPTYPLEVGNQLRVWGQLISRVASGTAPFVVDSPTKVANLNADALDGYDSADLLGGSVEIPVTAATYFYNGGNPYYCKKKAVSAAGLVTFSNINDNLECNLNHVCSSGECVPGTSYTYCDEDNDAHYSSIAVASYKNCPSGRYRHNQVGDDCDDACATCYPGSLVYTFYPDGHDQDCNDSIDEYVPLYYLYETEQTARGDFGGRSAADTLCNTTINKPDRCSSAGFAFISVNASDQILNFPTTKNVNTAKPWYWHSSSSVALVAYDWADLLDGTILNGMTAVGYYGGIHWTGSTAYGTVDKTCQEWTYCSNDQRGTGGLPNETSDRWLKSGGYYCSSAYKLICACETHVYR